MLIKINTGFFFELEKEHPVAIDIWNTRAIATSVIVVYELQKKLLRRKFEGWKIVIEDIKKSVLVVSLTADIALKASHIAYTTGILGLDVLILSSLLEAGCKEIYTTDSHFELYREKRIKIINLGKAA